jgi:hypothetical protein
VKTVPGQNTPPPMNPLRDVPAVNIAGLRFQVAEITPVLAAEWLKLNRKNRKLKYETMLAYARDMKNNAWYLTHQGVAFDAEGNLIDGQHRLEAVVNSKRAVNMFVSAGWPTGNNGGKHKTMDAVDRGVNRSIADQLRLQHDIMDAARVVQIANSIAAACLGSQRVRKSSTACVLSVVDLYAPQIKFVLENPIKTHGLKSATVAAVLVLARAAWPDKTDDFMTRLKTGENLTRDNPILHLRNYLMGEGSGDTSGQRLATCHHLLAFVEGRKLSSVVCTSNVALLQLLKLQGERVEKIRKIFGDEALTIPAPAVPAAEDKPAPINTAATGPDALRIAGTLRDVFSTTDLAARLDNANLIGLWLSDWRRRGWIETVGTREYQKTGSFGKV